LILFDLKEIEHAWGELDKDSEKTDEATVRIAVCNMDWNRVRSDDLMVLLNSFVPAGGTIKKVAVRFNMKLCLCFSNAQK
jgi:hypothetical protein